MATPEAACQECLALQLSDECKCPKEATHANGVFCWFHAKQAFGLYKGYKRRNLQLDKHDESAPDYLRKATIPLANQTFEDIVDEQTLKDVHTHLFDKYVLIGKIVDARKFHHKYFYSFNCDYGHQAYVDKLSSQRHTVLRALEKLGKRTADVLYKDEQWFDWVRSVQEEDEASREKEQKRIKQEAALFKRHRKTLEAQMKLAKQKADKNSQDAFLEEAYRERVAASAGELEDDEAWDPMEDVLHQRNQYIDLIRHFLWMDVLSTDDATSTATKPAQADETAPFSKKSKKKAKAKAVPSAAAASGIDEKGQEKIMAMMDEIPTSADANSKEPDKSMIETEAEMRKRLSQGVEKKY